MCTSFEGSMTCVVEKTFYSILPECEEDVWETQSSLDKSKATLSGHVALPLTLKMFRILMAT